MQLLLGGLPAAEQARVREAMASGTAALTVGTHAMLGERSRFCKLGLVVVDEEHRFGVRQRERLRGKGTTPHVLVMSATPIPRTLALTAYGDLDVTVIPDRPPGRQPPRTHLVRPDRQRGALAFIGQRVARGGQAFVVCPAVEAGESALPAVDSTCRALEDGPFRGLALGVLHGRLPSTAKAEVLDRFRSRALQVLVATTVVEVGVDVPAADVMVILGPDRFGLAQLHQLRGRVGRDGQAAQCLVFLSGAESQEARARLALFQQHADGFELAEEDLRLRGPGELLGVRQHGLPGLRLADPRRDQELLRLARRAAFAGFAAGPRD